MAAPDAIHELAEVLREGPGFVKKVGHKAAVSAGLTKDSGYSGAKYLGALLAMLYEDFATWYDIGFCNSLVGKAINANPLPRIGVTLNEQGHTVPVLVRGMTAYEAKQWEAHQLPFNLLEYEAQLTNVPILGNVVAGEQAFINWVESW